MTIFLWPFEPKLQIIFFLYVEQCQLLFHIHPPQLGDMEKIALCPSDRQCFRYFHKVEPFLLFPIIVMTVINSLIELVVKTDWSERFSGRGVLPASAQRIGICMWLMSGS